jgi:hypothetical protein
MPAFPPETFINDTFGLLGNTVLVLAPDAGIPPEPECLVKPVIECGLFELVHGPVHPPDQISIPRVKIIRDIIGAEFTAAWHPLEPEKEARGIFVHHAAGVIR